jgi:hypothetical protein
LKKGQYNLNVGLILSDYLMLMWRDSMSKGFWILMLSVLPVAGEQEKVNLSTYDVHCIAGVLKKYLRELPNPLIPVEMYNRFIEAASKYCTCLVKTVIRLVILLLLLL